MADIGLAKSVIYQHININVRYC